MDQAAAIRELALLTSEVAARCWEALGTDRSKAIQQACSRIIEDVQDA